MEFKNIDQLLEKVRGRREVKRLAVAAAADLHVLEAACRARREGIIEPLLIGDRPQMEQILEQLEEQLPPSSLIHEPDVDRAACPACPH